MKVPIEGNTPGLRYGHTMVYILPILILFGGSGWSEILNDVWILSTDKVPFK
jgi:protein phosphatase